MGVTVGEDAELFSSNRDQSALPYLMQIPTSFIRNSKFFPIFTPECLKWYLYDYAKPEMSNSKIINSILQDPFTEYCEKHDINVPYFRRPKDRIQTDMYNAILEMDKQPFLIGKDQQGGDVLPDGGITFIEENRKGVSVNLQVNDLRLSEYHRTNGVTKLSFRIDTISDFILNKKKKVDEKNAFAQRIAEETKKFRESKMGENAGWPTLTITEALMNLQDMLTRNI